MKTLSDHILDIIQNALGAKATLIEIMVAEDKINDLCLLIIKDNGCGMSPETVQKATTPFFTSRKTRIVGLGLSLLKQYAQQTGGDLQLQSEPEKGTEVTAGFQLSHIDRKPLGDIWESFYLTMLGNPKVNVVYKHKTKKGEFIISSSEIKKAVGEGLIRKSEIKNGITDLIKNNLDEIGATK